VLDPPWPSTDAALPYPKLGLEEIAGLPIPQLLNADAVVWLWTTNTFLFEAERLAREAWGLNYRNLLTWAKDRVGTGHWLRGQTEHCLLLTRGKPTLRLGSYSTLLTADVREHSRKPDEFYSPANADPDGRSGAPSPTATPHRPTPTTWQGRRRDRTAPRQPH